MNVLLTGATSGIGFETLKELIVGNHTIYAVGRDFTKIQSFTKKHKDLIKEFVFDLSNIDEIENLFKTFNLKDQKLDALIHCAGMEETVPLRMFNPSKVKTIYDINVFSGIELLRYFTKKKYSKDGASVVFLSSVMGVLGQSGKIGYCSTKAAIIGMVKASALEFSKRKIRVNAVLPGIVNTPMTEKLFSQLSEENVNQIIEMHPLGIGEVADVTPMILFLISNKSRWITGQNFIIDGGYSIK
ncbi:SDR family NAD(P)-dependent oxidoreductase [Polaribacter vadi]|uniref:Short-chain dehydrogenase n=1 Tax=Polaribacter vadi TaxID=1774273 RepID=A0A1B8TYV9_9FLAO|nr:SDR family oxidoreductase [Polaribacter vadi]OBY64838.1 hypothetical protein LPB3_05445 [Polaribacter vadi]